MACHIPITNPADIMQTSGYYLRCRDVDGTSVIITPTATGLGAHTRWIYPAHAENKADEENSMNIDDDEETIEGRFATPPPQHTFDAGSVIRTPVKKLVQPLQRSPKRIGFSGIDFWHDNSLGKRIVEQTSDGPTMRYILQQPIGSATNLSRDQILEHEFQRNHATFLTQVGKLLGHEEREKVTREILGMTTKAHFASPQPTIIIEEEEVSEDGVGLREEQPQHLGSIMIERKEWQVYKTLRPRKDGQPRIIRSSPAQPKTRRARKSIGKDISL